MPERDWKPEPPLFHKTLPEARWSYSPPPMRYFRRKRNWKKLDVRSG